MWDNPSRSAVPQIPTCLVPTTMPHSKSHFIHFLLLSFNFNSIILIKRTELFPHGVPNKVSVELILSDKCKCFLKNKKNKKQATGFVSSCKTGLLGKQV